MQKLATSLAFALLISACYSPQAKAISLTELPSEAAKIVWKNPFLCYVLSKWIVTGHNPSDNVSTLAAANSAEVGLDFVVGDAHKKNMNLFTKTVADRMVILMIAAYKTFMNPGFINDKEALLYVLGSFSHTLAGNYLGK